ncbi:MAG: cmpC [Verrucomicrobiaceae bacterium]|nr:cmpC [Verrucomicrobiaceae bacterium]MDB6116665.1 cmpC [Verrucomicrobiaceae bacterium]
MKTVHATRSTPTRRGHYALRVGYVPLLDCAPLIAAVELGMCERNRLNIKLMRQPGWANIRDNVIFGELDAAHAPAGLLLAINAGLAPVPAHCVTAFVFSQQGNAITLSKRLYDRGIRDLADLAQEAKHRREGEMVTLGVVSRYSTHAHLLRQWLRQGGMKAEKDVRIVILPPMQMSQSLAAGHVDGFCVGEPWNTVAVAEGHGWLAGHSSTLAPGHPEKVLMVRRDFAEQREAEHLALVASLFEAAAWCAEPANRNDLAAMLHRHAFPALTPKLIKSSLASEDAPIFHGPELHRPAPAKASWLVDEMQRHGLLTAAAAVEAHPLEAFRPDIYDLALSQKQPALIA